MTQMFRTQFMYGQFPLGRLVTTPGAAQALEDNHEDPMAFILRHANGDWGDLCAEDKAMNDSAVSKRDDRILSAYKLGSGDKLYIITEWDRSYTTMLLAEEY